MKVGWFRGGHNLTRLAFIDGCVGKYKPIFFLNETLKMKSRYPESLTVVLNIHY